MNRADAREPLAGRRAIGWGLVALGLVTVVAMAAHGAAWSKAGDGEERALPHAVAVSGVVVAAVVAALLFVLSLARVGARETPQERRRRWMAAFVFIAILVAISLARQLVFPSEPGDRANPPATQPPPGQQVGGSGNDGGGSPTWWPLAIVGLGTAAALVAATARRNRAPASAPADDTATIALLEASLDDLRSEPDPRRAVVAAYARMEGGLGASGFARDPAETPTEYLGRAQTVGADGPLRSHPIAVRALAELTGLAEHARFSTLTIDEPMRARAIDALEELRRSLRPDVALPEVQPEKQFGPVR